MMSTPELASRLSRTYLTLSLVSPTMRCLWEPGFCHLIPIHTHISAQGFLLPLPRAAFLAWPTSTPQPHCPLLYNALLSLSQNKSYFPWFPRVHARLSATELVLPCLLVEAPG